MLIHGFNNDQEEAELAFDRFTREQWKLGTMRTPIVRVLWPGDVGVPHYARSIPNAQGTARLLADELRKAAAYRGGLVVDIVAHSMGCRLSLELLHELRAVPEPLLRVRRIAMMAAAIPRRLLASHGTFVGGLRPPLDASGVRVLSLYSYIDLVLLGAFPAGQTIANLTGLDGAGVIPVPLGLAPWRVAAAPAAGRFAQLHAKGAGHGSYWKNSRGNVARRIRRFLQLGPFRRQVDPRTLESRVRRERSLAAGPSRQIRERMVR